MRVWCTIVFHSQIVKYLQINIYGAENNIPPYELEVYGNSEANDSFLRKLIYSPFILFTEINFPCESGTSSILQISLKT